MPSIDPTIPLPSENGISETIQFYKDKFGKDLSREDAREILARIIRFKYLVMLTNLEAEEPEQAKELSKWEHAKQLEAEYAARYQKQVQRRAMAGNSDKARRHPSKKERQRRTRRAREARLSRGAG